MVDKKNMAKGHRNRVGFFITSLDSYSTYSSLTLRHQRDTSLIRVLLFPLNNFTGSYDPSPSDMGTGHVEKGVHRNKHNGHHAPLTGAGMKPELPFPTQNLTSVSYPPSQPVVPDGSGIPTGNIPTGNIPTGNIPTGNIPTGNIPTGNPPTGSLPTGNLTTGNLPTGNAPAADSFPSTNVTTGDVPTGVLPTGNLTGGNQLPGGNITGGNYTGGDALITQGGKPYVCLIPDARRKTTSKGNGLIDSFD